MDGSNHETWVDEYFECPVCSNDMTSKQYPWGIVEPCGHSVCMVCLGLLQQRAGEAALACPICRQPSTRHSQVELSLLMRSLRDQARDRQRADRNAAIAERRRLEAAQATLQREREALERQVEAERTNTEKLQRLLDSMRNNQVVALEKKEAEAQRLRAEILQMETQLKQHADRRIPDTKLKELQEARDRKALLEQELEQGRRELETVKQDKAEADRKLVELRRQLQEKEQEERLRKDEEVRRMSMEQERQLQQEGFTADGEYNLKPLLAHLVTGASGSVRLLWTGVTMGVQVFKQAFLPTRGGPLSMRRETCFKKMERRGARYDSSVWRVVDNEVVIVVDPAAATTQTDGPSGRRASNGNVAEDGGNPASPVSPANLNHAAAPSSSSSVGVKREQQYFALKTCRSFREPMLLHNLRHPHVMELLGVVSTDSADKPSTLMPFLPNDLEYMLLQPDELGLKRVEPQFARKVFGAVLAAVAYTHRQGVVHRNIKPGAVLLDQNVASVRLACWTEAVYLGEQPLPPLVGRARRYQSPEFMLFDSAGVADWKAYDVWALGCVLLELLLESSASPLVTVDSTDVTLRLRAICEWEELRADATQWVGSRNPDDAGVTLMRRVLNETRATKSLAAVLQDRLLSEDAVRLLRRMLAWDPTKRIRAEDALHDEYLNGIERTANGLDVVNQKELTNLPQWIEKYVVF